MQVDQHTCYASAWEQGAAEAHRRHAWSVCGNSLTVCQDVQINQRTCYASVLEQDAAKAHHKGAWSVCGGCLTACQSAAAFEHLRCHR